MMKVLCPICQEKLKIYNDEEIDNQVITTYHCRECKVEVQITTDETE